MALNGISTSTYKADRQLAKLELAATKRAATGRRSNLDITELPTVYAPNDNLTADVIDNPNVGGLVIGRPWTDGPPPPPPPTTADFGWVGDGDAWYVYGNSYGNSIYSSPAPANPSYTYPDGSYTGKTRNFTGSEWMSSPNLSVPGAWQSNQITIDFWFYPTSYGVQLMSESSYPDVTSGYHYSMLEIDSSGYVHARFYNAQHPSGSITSMLPVALNRWNHVWMTEFSNGAHSFELNGIPTNGNYAGSRIKPFPEYFVIGLADTTSLGFANSSFKGKIGYLTISDYQQAPSSFSQHRNRFKPAFVGFQSNTNGGSNGVHIDSDPFNDNWLSTVPVGATIEAEGYGTYTVTSIAAPTDVGNFSQNWFFSVTPNTSNFASGTRMTFSW